MNMTRTEYEALQQTVAANRMKGINAGGPRGVQLDPPPKVTLSEGSEANIHDHIIRDLRQRGYLFFHGAMGTRSHRTEGEPDFTIFLPGGVILFVEVKTPTGKLSPAQQAVHHHAARFGTVIRVVRGVQEYQQLIHGVLNPHGLVFKPAASTGPQFDPATLAALKATFPNAKLNPPPFQKPQQVPFTANVNDYERECREYYAKHVAPGSGFIKLQPMSDPETTEAQKRFVEEAERRVLGLTYAANPKDFTPRGPNPNSTLGLSPTYIADFDAMQRKIATSNLLKQLPTMLPDEEPSTPSFEGNP